MCKLVKSRLTTQEGKPNNASATARETEQGKSSTTTPNGNEAHQHLGQFEIEEQIEHEVEPNNINFMAEPMHIGWLNIQNINRSGIRQQLVKQAEHYALKCLALTETHQTEAGMERHDDYYLYFAPGKAHTPAQRYFCISHFKRSSKTSNM